MERNNSIFAIIVTYNPDSYISENVESALKQVNRLLIIDNNSNESSKATLQKLSDNNQKIELILNNENIGLAAAQNLGLEKALFEQADWILLLDDDSQMNDNMATNMLTAYENHADKEQIAIIAPYIEEQNAKIEPKYMLSAGQLLFKRTGFGDKEILNNVLACIASGSLIKTSTIKELGLFKTQYFIDYIDTEFCLRVISANYKIIAVKNAILNHHLGEKTLHNVGEIRIPTSNHSAKRRFTIYRNRVWVWKKYLFKTPNYIFYDTLASFYDIFRIAAFEKEKFTKLKMVIKGLIVGLFKACK